MKTKAFTQALERVENWPAQAQDELTEIAREIHTGLNQGAYVPTPAELAGIDRGLADAEAGRFASDAEVETALTKLRGD